MWSWCLSAIGDSAGVVFGGGTYYASGGNWDYTRRAYQIGDMAGGLVGAGFDDVLLRGARYGHAFGQVGVTSAFAGAGFAGRYAASGGNLDSALFWGIASMPGNMVAKKLVPCFRAGSRHGVATEAPTDERVGKRIGVAYDGEEVVSTLLGGRKRQ